MKIQLLLLWASLLLWTEMVLAEPPSDEQRVRERVVELIAMGRKPTSWTEDTTNRLLKDLAANDGRLRWVAGWALGNGPACLIPRLDEIARDGSPQERRPAAMALSRLVKTDSSALRPLWRMRKSGDPIEEYYIAEGIARVSLEQAGLRRTLLLLPEAMGIRPGDGYRPQGLTPGVRPNGTPWLHNTSWLEVTLFKLGPPSVADAPMLKELLNHQHPVTRRMAQEQIAMLGERAANFTDAVQTLLSDSDDEVCIQALHTLKRLGEITPEAREAIQKLLDDSGLLQPAPQVGGVPTATDARRSRQLGRLALSTLVDLGVRDVSDEILAAIQSGVLRTEEEETMLIEGLVKLTDKLPQVLVTMLSSDERRVRTTAARAIGAFGERADKVAPDLVSTLRRELKSDEADALATRRAIWRALGKIGAPDSEAVEVLEGMLETVPHRGWKKEIEFVIARCRGESTRASAPVEVKSRGSTRDTRRIRIRELLAHATDKSSLAHETRGEAMRLLSLRRRARNRLADEAASVVRDFIRDMRGGAPSRKVAIERLRASFNDMEEANVVLIRLYNDYGYRGVFRPYVDVARWALGLEKKPMHVILDETAFPDAVLAMMKDPSHRSSFRQLVNSGPAGVPFLAPFVGHAEKRVHVPMCFKLRTMGPLAVEATPALLKAVDGAHSKYTLMALQRVNPSAYDEVVGRR